MVIKKSILLRYNVNEVPIALKPMFYLYGYGIPFILFAYFLFVCLTSKIVITGKKHIEDNPTWYMKTSHVMLRFVGVKKIILGSSGHSGREAANKLVAYLKKGYSTVILPDGPSVPPFKMKKGAFHIALQSHVPIVPIRFKASPCFVSPNWDHRQWPIPFSEIKVIVGKAIYITEENFKSAYNQVTESLGK